MELEQKLQHEYVDLIPTALQAIPQSSPPPVVEAALSEQGDVVIHDDDPVMDVYNLSFDEF